MASCGWTATFSVTSSGQEPQLDRSKEHTYEICGKSSTINADGVFGTHTRQWRMNCIARRNMGKSDYCTDLGEILYKLISAFRGCLKLAGTIGEQRIEYREAAREALDAAARHLANIESCVNRFGIRGEGTVRRIGELKAWCGLDAREKSLTAEGSDSQIERFICGFVGFIDSKESDTQWIIELRRWHDEAVRASQIIEPPASPNEPLWKKLLKETDEEVNQTELSVALNINRATLRGMIRRAKNWAKREGITLTVGMLEGQKVRKNVPTVSLHGAIKELHQAGELR